MVLRDAPRSLPACIGDFVVAKRDPSSVTLLRMQVDGTVRYQGNRAFDDLVYDSAELNAAMEAQGVGCPSELFLHPDDKPNVCRLLSGVLRRLNAAVPDDDAGTYASSEPDVWPLQLVLKGSGLPMMTRAYLRVVTYHGGRMSFWAWRFDPVAAAAPPEPSLETPGAFATRRLGAAASPADAAGAGPRVRALAGRRARVERRQRRQPRRRAALRPRRRPRHGHGRRDHRGRAPEPRRRRLQPPGPRRVSGPDGAAGVLRRALESARAPPASRTRD